MVVLLSSWYFRSSRPGNDVSAGNFPKFIRSLDPGKFYKILKGILIHTPRLRLVDIGEPFDFERHISQATEVGCAQKSASRRELWQEDRRHPWPHVIIDNICYQ